MRLGDRHAAVDGDDDVAVVVEDALGRLRLGVLRRVLGEIGVRVDRRGERRCSAPGASSALIARRGGERREQQQRRGDREPPHHSCTSGTWRSSALSIWKNSRRREAAGARDEVGRERLDGGVVVAHRAVVVAARHLQLVLDLGQLALQLEEAARGAQLGVGLGDRQQAAQLGAERVLAVLQRARRLPGAAQAGHLLEHLPLVAGVRAHHLERDWAPGRGAA